MLSVCVAGEGHGVGRTRGEGREGGEGEGRRDMSMMNEGRAGWIYSDHDSRIGKWRCESASIVA